MVFVSAAIADVAFDRDGLPVFTCLVPRLATVVGHCAPEEAGAVALFAFHDRSRMQLAQNPQNVSVFDCWPHCTQRDLLASSFDNSLISFLIVALMVVFLPPDGGCSGFSRPLVLRPSAFVGPNNAVAKT